ncbi:MAG: peptidylprolyl isomerase [Phycisphaerae bacterium]
MNAIRVGLVLVAATAGLAGCRDRLGDRPLGTFTPEATARNEYDTGAGAADEEMNPVQMAQPAGKPEPREAEPSTGTLTRPDEDAEYEARLSDVGPAVAGDTGPLLVEAGDGEDPGSLVLVDAVLAEVNGEVITREDILGPIRPQMRKWRREYPDEAFRSRCRQVINIRLKEEISRRLVYQEAEADLSEEEKERIDLTLGKMLKGLAAEAGSMLLLEEKLKGRGSSIEERREEERRRIVVQRYLHKKIGPNIHITHSELLNYYNDVRPQRYERPTRVRLGLITIRKAEAADPDEARALAEAVHQRAASGEDFARLARRYSHGPMAEKGGDWGFIREGSFRVQAVDEALFALNAGQVGPLVETDEAFHVVKALAREGGRTVPFTEVQDELEDEIRDRKFNEKVDKYIRNLYERGYVRVMTDNL